MSQEPSPKLRDGFCIYIDTICQGPVPVVSDGDDKYVVFETALEAQKEIVDNQMTRLRQFLDGEREFEDAMNVEEYVVPVTVHPDGVIVDAAGNCFGPKMD
jgi:phosphatidylserine decarboxylase